MAAAWLAIASWHQGRRDEAKTWFDQADRYVRRSESRRPSRVSSIAPGGPGPKVALLIAWREAQGLLLDADFPADPFAR